MNNDDRNEILNVLAELWKLSPDVRLGQLFAHLGFLGEVHLDKGLGYIEDDELLAVMYRHRSELAARLQVGSVSPLSEAAETSVSGSQIQS